MTTKTFDELGLPESLRSTIADLGFETPTPVQARAIPPALEGRDVLGLAQTGTGKTAAFGLPLLSKLLAGGIASEDEQRKPRALVLAPTRELADQIFESFGTFAKGTGLRGCVIYGGVSYRPQLNRLRRGVDVIVATPGRLMDLMEQGHATLDSVEVFVLDEVDRMLDMGFIDPIRKISAKIPERRQSLLFSATLPRAAAGLADSLLTDPVRVEIAPKKTKLKIEQLLHVVPEKAKPELLESILIDETIERAVVFTKTKHNAEQVSERLLKSGVRSESIHGDKSQAQRRRALESFRAGRSRVLVATDVAARGLDVDGVTHVINYHLPNEPEAYVHRIGRTGRAGASGIAVAFCSKSELGYLRRIERLTGKRLEAIGGPHPDADRPVSKPASRPASKPKKKHRRRDDSDEHRLARIATKTGARRRGQPGSKTGGQGVAKRTTSGPGKPSAKAASKSGPKSRGRSGGAKGRPAKAKATGRGPAGRKSRAASQRGG